MSRVWDCPLLYSDPNPTDATLSDRKVQVTARIGDIPPFVGVTKTAYLDVQLFRYFIKDALQAYRWPPSPLSPSMPDPENYSTCPGICRFARVILIGLFLTVKT